MPSALVVKNGSKMRARSSSAHARAVVGDAQPDAAARASSRRGSTPVCSEHAARASALRQRLLRIDQQVQHDLADLVAVGHAPAAAPGRGPARLRCRGCGSCTAACRPPPAPCRSAHTLLRSAGRLRAMLRKVRTMRPQRSAASRMRRASRARRARRLSVAAFSSSSAGAPHARSPAGCSARAPRRPAGCPSRVSFSLWRSASRWRSISRAASRRSVTSTIDAV